MDLVDIHHGDDVELSFYHSNRMVTVSFHQFFAGTGNSMITGPAWAHTSVRTSPYETGLTMRFVLQCGADSLGRDRLGAFNLSIVAHGECVNFVPKFNVPLLVQGGGALLAQRYRTNRLPRSMTCSSTTRSGNFILR